MVMDPETAKGPATEKTDAKPKGILEALAYLLLATAAVAWGVVYLTRDLVTAEVKNDPPPAPLAEPAGRLPPEPRLQTLPFADIEALRAEEKSVLTSYGWVDRKAGVVRIPIEQAMKLLAERGLPQAAGDPAPAGAQAGGAR
jgi:hypothetical protein